MWEVTYAEHATEKEAELLAVGWEPFGVYAMQQLVAAANSPLSASGTPGKQVMLYKPVVMYRRDVMVQKVADFLDEDIPDHDLVGNIYDDSSIDEAAEEYLDTNVKGKPAWPLKSSV